MIFNAYKGYNAYKGSMAYQTYKELKSILDSFAESLGQ
jgi:hypothetical protein